MQTKCLFHLPLIFLCGFHFGCLSSLFSLTFPFFVKTLHLFITSWSIMVPLSHHDCMTSHQSEYFCSFHSGCVIFGLPTSGILCCLIWSKGMAVLAPYLMQLASSVRTSQLTVAWVWLCISSSPHFSSVLLEFQLSYQIKEPQSKKNPKNS